jgi:L-ornithine Nalpha-acyltransferase
MQSYRSIIARTAQEITDAQRLRWTVYGEEEALLPASARVDGREIDARDYCEGTTHFLVYDGQEAVGTVRLLEPSSALGLDLDLDAKFDLGALSAPGIAPAEVTRYCVLQRYRRTRVATALFLRLFKESSRRGITHWVAGANMGTDCAEDAALAYRVACAQKLVTPRFHAEPRDRERPDTPRRRPCYTEEQRRRAEEGDLTGLELPRTLSLFANRMGARYIGSPAYDAYFNVFALPLVATLADIAAQQATATTATTSASADSVA